MKVRKMISMMLIAVMIAGLFLPGSSFAAEAADTIYMNGNIYTVDDDFSVVTAIAVKDGKILDVGSDKAITDDYQGTNTKVVDLGGKTVIPGLIESHMHYQALGELLDNIDIFQKPKAEILALV
ncbi:MAG: amidohydrolase, partial [Clostridiales Family XIII bacterium]|nr:amidohydrolase [Clostridiales Family XIII bacterium]